MYWLTIAITIMVNKRSVFGCFTNYEGHEVGTVFGLRFVKVVYWKQQVFRFCNRSNLNPSSSILIFEKHFEESFMRRNTQQPRLINKLNPVRTRGHPLSKYAKFSAKLTFLTRWYAQERVRIRGLEMLVLRKILRKYLMDGPLVVSSN